MKNTNGNIFYNTLKSITNWLETGDLVLLIVLVSAVHFAAVLAKYDYTPVAIALGLLVDLGIWRTVRSAVRYQGANKFERVARFTLAIAMIGISYAYHERYYGDVLLAAPVPFLIAALSWLDSRKPVKAERKEAQPEMQPAQENEPMKYMCVSCSATFDSQQGLAAHTRKHLREKTNGHKVKDIEK